MEKTEIRAYIRNKLPDYDWIDTGDRETSVGLEHLSEEEFNEHKAGENEVVVGGGTGGYTEEDYDKLEEALEEIKKKLSVEGGWTGASGDFFEYTFYTEGQRDKRDKKKLKGVI